MRFIASKRNGEKKMSEYLPVEVMVEILKRLPVKSVVKYRLVCKTWNILIKTPSFISTHLQTSLSKPHSHPLLLHKWVGIDKEPFSLHFDNHDFDQFQQLHYPVAVKGLIPYNMVVGSCNGLVCLHYGLNFFDLIFWNPSIQKYIKLPPPKPGITNFDKLIYGFGYDSTTNDYKLLLQPGENIETTSEAYLFSLNENSWKRVTSISPNYAVPRHISATFVNGALHWLGCQKRKDGGFSNTILGFDISSDEYFVISLPESLIGLSPWYLAIMKYEESSIAVLKTDWEDYEIKQLELWVMKTYGVVGSWTKVLHLTDQSGFGSLPTVLGFRKSGEVLLKLIGAELASLDLNCHQMKHLRIQEEYGIASVNSYVESLVLLDKGVDADDSSGK